MKTVPLEFFKPLGNPLVIVSQTTKTKLQPRGDFGKLIGFNVDLKLYKVLLSNGKIINTKNVQFLDFDASISKKTDLTDLIEELRQEKEEQPAPVTNEEAKEEKEPIVKEEEVEDLDSWDNNFQSFDSTSSKDNIEIVETLIPAAEAPVGQILRCKTQKWL
ncbi:hypothetical protein PGTUg99_024468 [Puccinia graminis f. sp. tritici]|uniref:Uncharacterized protein n=1 Tax=Puccinia graminis f. sp. tritici TaxID=56615 RepID=A0A5B0S900_PUCGR|nr:hypothetical protein PGTUg99_024468 [Puccinia graminis f. sp. tritici]